MQAFGLFRLEESIRSGCCFRLIWFFLNKEKEVVHVEEVVRPFRISRVSLKATSVLELPPHTIYRTGTRIGDRFEISSARAPQAVAVQENGKPALAQR